MVYPNMREAIQSVENGGFYPLHRNGLILGIQSQSTWKGLRFKIRRKPSSLSNLRYRFRSGYVLKRTITVNEPSAVRTISVTLVPNALSYANRCFSAYKLFRNLRSIKCRAMTPLWYFLFGLAVFFMVFWSGKWVVHILAIVYAKYRLHRKVQNLPSEAGGLPGVTILKPLMGVDPNLFSNLETFFTMNYPLYEIHFCIEDESDPAIMVAKRLQGKYPNVVSKIFTGGSNVGVNPKINNMYQGFKESSFPLILISDSGIRMKEDTLLDMVNHLKDNVALVHQMPFTCDRSGFAGTLEKVYFGTAQARIYLAADLLRINCHTGMSTLVRKHLIEEAGGLEAYSCYLAEDFFLAKSMIDRGWKITISSQPAWQNSGICEVQFFQARLRRWVKLRVAMLPLTLLFEPLSECLVLGACTAWAVFFLFNWDPILFYLVHTLVWFFCDWILLSIIQNTTLPFNKVDFVIGWFFREACSPYQFLKALFNPTIKWRSRTYKLKWGGVAEECKV